MITHEQRQYLEDVLGIQSAGFVLTNPFALEVSGEAVRGAETTQVAPVGSATETTHYEVLVLTYPLQAEEKDLLNKILASIKLVADHHEQQENISLAELPTHLTATHVLAFANYPTGRNQFDNQTWWVLPPLDQMVGQNADVVARKKETWNLLQQFAREAK